MELKDLKSKHDKAYNHNQVTRERAADDIVFYWLTHWDDNTLADSQLGYRGEFDIIRKAGRGILADLASNPVQVDFEPIDEDRDDSADILDGLYRADNNTNTSIEAFSNSQQETVVCGVGAWLLYTEYESIRDDDNTNQVIRRKPIYEANNTVYWDPNAKSLDKSDAKYCSVLRAYSEDGYKELVEELTGEDCESVNYDSFKEPEQSYSFPWIGGEGKTIYVTEFYDRELVREKVLVMTDPIGQEITLRESDLADVMDEMLDTGFEIVAEKKINRWQVTKYIASGGKILHECVIVGEHIPVVPQYGEHAIIEGQEHYEGVTRLAKDPQRLRDFQLSYLADIVSRSPRQKPIFMQEQIAGFEQMYEIAGSENNYPYVLMNRLAGDGSELPLQPVGVLPEQPIPSALIASINLSREAVEDVANPGIPQDVADPDTSGKAILAVQNRIDLQNMIYQEHTKHAHRRDGVIYASMAADTYDVPRTVKLVKPDGSKQVVQIMETVIDQESGEIVTLNDINNVEFNVYSDIGPSFSSKKEQTIERLQEMSRGLQPGDPIGRALMLKTLYLMDGVDFEDIREYANRELILSGIKKPTTEEDQAILAEAANEQKESSAEMVLAMAEDKKGQAALGKVQLDAQKVQMDTMSAKVKAQIEMFKAQTDRIDSQIDAQKAGADINYKRVDTFGKQLDNQAKIIQLRTPAEMSDDDILKELMG